MNASQKFALGFAAAAIVLPQPAIGKSLSKAWNGAWQLNVTGSGRFLMDSLKLSTLGLSILAPASDTPEPLGQPLTRRTSNRATHTRHEGLSSPL